MLQNFWKVTTTVETHLLSDSEKTCIQIIQTHIQIIQSISKITHWLWQNRRVRWGWVGAKEAPKLDLDFPASCCWLRAWCSCRRALEQGKDIPPKSRLQGLIFRNKINVGSTTPPSNSHHEVLSDLQGDPYKPWFATVIGWGGVILHINLQVDGRMTHDSQPKSSRLGCPNEFPLLRFPVLPCQRAMYSAPSPRSIDVWEVKVIM